MSSTYCLIVEGSFPGSADWLADRFEGLRIWIAADRTVIDCPVPDQPALRALVTQVWDLGGRVLLLADVSGESQARR